MRIIVAGTIIGVLAACSTQAFRALKRRQMKMIAHPGRVKRDPVKREKSRDSAL